MRPLVIYYNFFNSSCRRDILRLILSWKLPGKLLCDNLVFHQLPLIQHCSIFYKKHAFQSTKNFRIQWQNMLLRSRISKFFVPPAYQRGGAPSRNLLHLCLRRSVRASDFKFINWDSYFNSFWEPWMVEIFDRFNILNQYLRNNSWKPYVYSQTCL